MKSDSSGNAQEYFPFRMFRVLPFMSMLALWFAGYAVLLFSASSAQAQPTPRWFVTNLSNGQILSGSYTVDLTVNDSTLRYLDLTLKVDGTDAGWSGEPTTGTGRQYTTFDIPTEEYADGAHTLQISDNQGNVQSYTVTFSDAINQVDVAGLFEPGSLDPDVPGSSQIQAHLTASQDWRVTIQTTEENPVVVRTYTGTGSDINVTWDGLNDAGIDIEDDAYDVVIESSAGSGVGAVPLLKTGVSAFNPGGPQVKRRTNKNRKGDALILLLTDKTIFPGGQPSVLKYKSFIASKLKPFVGRSITKLSFILINPGIDFRTLRKLTPFVKQINAHFQQRLQVFYVDSHGGVGPTPFFGIGPVTWYSNIPAGSIPRGLLSIDMSLLTASVGYGDSADPPALVWIDACHSAQDGDFSFANTFGSGAFGYGSYLGYTDATINYGAWAPPNDCWDFWRTQFWTEFTSGGRNFQTAIDRADSLTSGHGFGMFPYGYRPNERRQWTGSGITNL